MISVYLQGGLGNQLFQIFACISYAIEHKITFQLPLYNQNSKNPVSPYTTHSHIYRRPTYWSNFLSSLTPFVVDDNF